MQYQLLLMWIHITYFHTPPGELRLVVTSKAYNACWVCNHQHYPLDWTSAHLQVIWNKIRTGK